MNGQYILNSEGDPVPAMDIVTWGRWMQQADRKVARDIVSKGVEVSTVFLGLDHSFGDGPPLLWETMIFGGPNDQYQERYATLQEATEGHKKALQVALGPEVE
jgi:hypothetical protein